MVAEVVLEVLLMLLLVRYTISSGNSGFTQSPNQEDGWVCGGGHYSGDKISNWPRRFSRIKKSQVLQELSAQSCPYFPLGKTDFLEVSLEGKL